MGTFSEMAMAGDAASEREEIQPFLLETTESESPVDGNAPAEDIDDDARQQAEADAAAEALAKMTEEKELTPAQKKKEHEEAEAKRKTEWEAKHAAKQEAELMAWETAVAVSDEELASISLKRAGADSERVTRRNMKVCVTEHIQTKCLEDMDFARQVMHPRKNMINCFKYITRQARAYAEQEMKDNEEKPVNGVYDTDVPDGLCYQWAEDYFNDLEAEEDKDKDDTFVPKPYYGGSSSKSKKAPAKKPEKKAAAPKETAAKEPEKTAADGQLSFGSQMSLGELELAV